MFDNPEEELKKLEQQLLAAEESNDDFEFLYQDILQEFGSDSPKPSAPKASAPKKAAEKRSAQKKTAEKQPAPKKAAAKKPAAAKKKKSAPRRKRQRPVKGLVITLCLECAGILGILLWWLLRIL